MIRDLVRRAVGSAGRPGGRSSPEAKVAPEVEAVRSPSGRVVECAHGSPAAIAATAIDELGREWERSPRRSRRIDAQIRGALATAGITGGRVLEIGARKNPRLELFGGAAWEYTVMDLDSHTEGIETVIGDITRCPHLDDDSFDVIISVDVFEHIDRPWLAAGEITRLLRPGGLSYTSTLFAWRYHPVPIDYWRFTPPCLEFLFGTLETLEAGFDTTERRRDIRGRGRHDQVPVDAMGGFRENWRVFHIGRHP